MEASWFWWVGRRVGLSSSRQTAALQLITHLLLSRPVSIPWSPEPASSALPTACATPSHASKGESYRGTDLTVDDTVIYGADSRDVTIAIWSMGHDGKHNINDGHIDNEDNLVSWSP